MAVMFSLMLFMGESVAWERERGELNRLFMVPNTVATVLGGKIFSKLTIETGRAIILLVAAVILFGVTIKGSVLLVILLLLLGALCFAVLGIMISSRTPSQEEYNQMVIPFTMPMMFFQVFSILLKLCLGFSKNCLLCPINLY